ncbi:S1 family peptidase [Streptomyces buecherae]|uniref:S1 family peptidase n=1 Tax=Streptomyces buecherae TaxID=2763006 RepID=UPI001C25F7B1|nr:S1 family peptidase [Streptomyces buecherae]
MRPRPSAARAPRPMWLGVLLAVCALLLAGAPPAAAADRQTVVAGGDVIYAGSGGTCVVGFNAEKSGSPYGIVPGHCAETDTTWYADSARTISIGRTEGAGFPTSDYGLVRYTNTAVSFPGEIRLGTGKLVDITGAARPVVGHSMCHIGRVTLYGCGIVQSVNVSVNFPEGLVTGLFTSNACSERGDVGGPAFAGDKALGFIFHSGGGCRTAGRTYYKPIIPVLAEHGLVLR